MGKEMTFSYAEKTTGHNLFLDICILEVLHHVNSSISNSCPAGFELFQSTHCISDT